MSLPINYLPYHKPNQNPHSHSLWYVGANLNPPFSKVSTNVIKQFPTLIDKHFLKGHTLSNLKVKIRNHNGKILNKKSEAALDDKGNPKQCCTDQLNCLLKPDRCDQKNVIYQADVHADNKVMKYYGWTENEFKKRCSTHKSTFIKVPNSHTTLSSYIWKLKDKGIG